MAETTTEQHTERVTIKRANGCAAATRTMINERIHHDRLFWYGKWPERYAVQHTSMCADEYWQSLDVYFGRRVRERMCVGGWCTQSQISN